MEMMRQLTQEERDNARDNAYRVIIGHEPDRAKFTSTTPSKYPAYVRVTITAFCIIVLIAAFIPSAIRLHHIAVLTFSDAISDVASAQAAGWSAVLLAETGQLVFTLAFAVLDANRTQRTILVFASILCTVFALVGNVQLAKPMEQGEMFAWLESIAPPLLTVATAYVLKGQMLHSIEARYATQREFNAALNAWKERSLQPEQDASWGKRYANALRDALRKANNRSEKGRVAIATLTHGDWYALVQREMQIDNWYLQGEQSTAQLQTEQVQKLQQLEAHNVNLQDAIERLQATTERKNAPTNAGVHTGELTMAMHEQDGMHTANCVHCGASFTKATKNGARLALTAHLRGCKERKTQMQGSNA